MSLENDPVVRTGMLIRRPAAEVFEAFVDPEITSKFWFSRGSARLEEGAEVTWYWDMYGAEVPVQVEAIEPDRRILIAWPTAVEWVFDPRGDEATFVLIKAAVHHAASDDEKVAQALDFMGGFSFVLAGAKAWLEHGVRLELVADHNPDAHASADA